MTPEGLQLYLTRLKDIRETLTDPKRIKFIDDILNALQYKDTIIDKILSEQYKIVHGATQDYFDVKLKLEGCALRYGIPGWEIEKWLRMNPDQVVREVKFWQKMKQDCDELEGIKPKLIVPPRITKKPLLNWSKGLPSVPYKPQFSLKEVINNSTK